MNYRDVAYELAEEYGIEIIKDNESAPEQSYSFVKHEEPKKIYVRDTIKNRFHLLSIFHEIGHIELNHREWLCLTDEEIERMRIEEGEKALANKRLSAELEAWSFAFGLLFARCRDFRLDEKVMGECVAAYCTHVEKAYEDLNGRTIVAFSISCFRRIFEQLKEDYPDFEQICDHIIEHLLANKEPKE